MNEKRDEPTADFEHRAREVFDESIEHLDARTRSKLTQARVAALAQVDGKRRREWPWRVSAGSLATAAAVAVIVIAARAPIPATASLEDMEIVATEDSVDMLQDVDFYAWVDTEELPAGDSTT